METIKAAADLIKWAAEINQTIGQMNDIRKCDLQDVYGRSTTGDIDAAWLAPESEHARKLIICSVNNIMAFSEVERLLNVLARHKCLKQRAIDEEEFCQREMKLYEREHAFRDAQKPIHKKIRELRDECKDLRHDNRVWHERSDEWREERAKLRAAVQDFAAKAGKYEAIKKALEG